MDAEAVTVRIVMFQGSHHPHRWSYGMVCTPLMQDPMDYGQHLVEVDDRIRKREK